jgi:hypothetical protein
MEFALASKSFFVAYNKSMDSENYLTDRHFGFDHADLTEQDSDGNVLETDLEEAKAPSNMMFVHRTSFNNDDTTWTKFFLDADGLFRLTRDNRDDNLSFLEFSKEGKFRVKRQLENPYHDEADNFSEIAQDTNGEVTLRRVVDNEVSEIKITDAGAIEINHSSGSKIEFSENINLEASGSLMSGTMSRFIEQNHLIVSPVEPVNPKQFLVWLDTSDLQ